MYYVLHILAAHPSCIYSPEEMLQKANSNWQCERCKTCTVCCETSDAVSLLHSILFHATFMVFFYPYSNNCFI